jgi:hypothetical protein
MPGLYDLLFIKPDGTRVGVMLSRPVVKGPDQKPRLGPALFQGGYAAAELGGVHNYAGAATTQPPFESAQSVPIVQSDFSGGALYSKRQIPNGYAVTLPGYVRGGRAVTSPGAVTSVALSGLGVTLGTVVENNIFELGGNLYVLAGQYALKLAGGVSDPVVDKDLGASFSADGAALFNGAAYVGGSGGNIWKQTSGGVWSQSADVSHRKAGVVTWLIPTSNTMQARLVMANSSLTGIRYTGGDPMALGNWTPNPSSIPVGDSSFPIAGIAAAPNHVYIPKQDGLYDLNSRSETTNLLTEWKHSAITSDNGACSIYRDGYIYLGHALGADRYNAKAQQRQNLSTWIFPPFGVVNETVVQGPISAWAFDQGWLLGWAYNATLNTSYLGSFRARGEPGVPDGPGAGIWNFAEDVVVGRVTCSYATIVSGQPRLWTAARNGPTTTLQWQYLPNALNPLAELESDTGFRFGRTFDLRTSQYDWEDPDAIKTLRLIPIRADRLGSGVQITVLANAEGGDYTFQDIARTSPRSRIRPHAPLTSGHELALRLLGDGTPTNPPVLRAIKLDGEVQTEQFDRRTYPVRAGKQQLLRDGTEDRRNAARVWEDLAALHTEEDPVTVHDQEGSTLNARVHPITSYKATEDEANSGRYTREGIVSFTVLDIVSGASVGSGGVWGSGVKWGSGIVYGVGA